MARTRDTYPALVGLSVALVGGGGAVLLAPRSLPAPLAATVTPLADLWVVGVVLAGVGGALAALLALRSLQ